MDQGRSMDSVRSTNYELSCCSGINELGIFEDG